MARKLPEPLTNEDFHKLLDGLRRERDGYYMPRARRLKKRGQRINQYIIAIILGYGSGMRISEICGLEKKQNYSYQNKESDTKITKTIYTDIKGLTPDKVGDRYIRIQGGKGLKDRVVPYPSSLFRKVGLNKKVVLSNLPLYVTYRATQDFFVRKCKEILKKKCNFHMLRHGFVTNLMDNNVPSHQIQLFTGHSRLDTLGIYAHANPKGALDNYEGVEW